MPPTQAELQQELHDWQALLASDGWARLLAQNAVMRQTYIDWVDAQADLSLPNNEYGYGRMTAIQGEVRGRKDLIDWITARIAELEALLPPE